MVKPDFFVNIGLPNLLVKSHANLRPKIRYQLPFSPFM